MTYHPINIPIPVGGSGSIAGALPPAIDMMSSVSTVVVEAAIAPPGSMAALIGQHTHLNDNDYVSIGGHGLVYTPIAADAQPAALEALLANAVRFTPIDPTDPPSDGEAIGDFVTDTIGLLRDSADVIADDDGASVASPGETLAATTFVAESDTALDGLWVNGREASKLPDLDDHLPGGSILAKDGGDAAASKNQGVNGPSTSDFGAHASGEGIGILDPSVTIHAGGNALVNAITITNAGLDGGVFAVAGDHVELNAIIQTNAWSDSDSIGHGIAAQLANPFETTTAFNIAGFDRMDVGGEGGGHGFGAPLGWVVTQVTGDLVFLNWVQQFNFVTDQDIHIVASSGVKTMVTTGENLAFNDISINDIGNYYDLVLVGGSIYDANIISQMNVMLDDDIVGAVNGFSTTGTGSVSTGDNLLWNQALITNVGGAERFGDLSADYRAALDSFANGSKHLNGGVLDDEAFAGLAGLRVLHVTGSIYDLQYISQTNILGDSDEVALARHTAEAGLNADWTVETGSNTLVNTASIVDLDTTGKTYVGGDQYSYELLIQSEIIRTDQIAETRDADALVNEAVAFLGDGMIGPAPSEDVGRPGDADGTAMHASYHDVMQSVVS